LSQPHFEGSVRSPLTLPKMGVWSPPGLPKTQKTIAGVKTPYIDVFFISLEKVLKFRCPKWPRMSHLDICSPSYGQKKGRESNWQFDSWSLKVGNRPAPNVCWGSAIWRWKALDESYNIGLDLVSIGGWGEKLWPSKVPGIQAKTVLKLHFGNPETKKSFGCSLRGVTQSILYGGRWWLPPSSGCGESNESVLPVACTNTQSDPECGLTTLWLVFYAGSSKWIACPSS
jgi:hypothetical protein